MPQVEKARVFRNGRSQAVRIPAEFRFHSDEVYILRDPQSGVVSLSEKPFRRPIEEIFAEFDAAGGADFEIERDLSLPPERELL
jgi:antitoxin VapB